MKKPGPLSTRLSPFIRAYPNDMSMTCCGI
jgi:hypothetical protein